MFRIQQMLVCPFAACVPSSPRSLHDAPHRTHCIAPQLRRHVPIYRFIHRCRCRLRRHRRRCAAGWLAGQPPAPTQMPAPALSPVSVHAQYICRSRRTDGEPALLACRPHSPPYARSVLLSASCWMGSTRFYEPVADKAGTGAC